MQRLVIALIFVCAFSTFSQRKQVWPEKFVGATKVVYKTIGEVKLHLHVFRPTDKKSNTSAIVFFFGGGWNHGTPGQFEQQCRYLASRGMVAMTAEYRIRNMHGIRAKACVEDGKSAVRWVRSNAKNLGVNPNRIAAGGGSAGGHVAACAGVIKGFEAKDEDSEISSIPNAMILFNPPCVLAAVPKRKDYLREQAMAGMAARMGVAPEQLSPWHNVSKGQPPTLVLHGEADPTVPFWTSKVFVEKMEKTGNQAELAAYPRQQHGFFNYGRGNDKMFIATMQRTDEFLTKLGWLKGKSTIVAFAQAKRVERKR
ncbi:MAG: alpha/beta hydrolase [Verrucomicrobiota bacterium]|jgi:acetyl esterase/lipase|nr:alpha/beta hydrolase [Verrucomicrobiota bacterium]